MKAVGWTALVAGAFACVVPTAGAAPLPVAVIEEITGTPAGVEFMDYVEAGKVIRLKAKDSVVLSYMKSCVRESITGGTIVVGAEHSEVDGGKVVRTTVKCDAGSTLLSARQANQFAGMVFRNAPPPGAAPPIPEPQFTLYGRSPMVELPGPATLVIERLDKAGERHVLTIGKQQLLRGAFYDLAKAGKSLVAGGIYRASAGGQPVVFKIDADARPGAAPIIGRLLRFEPTS